MKTKIKIYIEIGCFALIMMVLSYIFILGKIFDIQNTSASLAIEKNELSLLEKNRQRFPQMKKDYKTASESLEKINNAIVGDSNAVDFIVDLENLARNSGNQQELEIISTTATGEAPLKFRLRLWGNFDRLMQFLNGFSNMAYLTSIDSMSTQRLDAKDLQGRTGLFVGDLETVVDITSIKLKK